LIPEETIENAVEAGKSFFSLPESTKMEVGCPLLSTMQASDNTLLQIDIHKSSNYKGYTALLAENTDVTGNGDLHEGFDLGWEAKGEAKEDVGRPTSETSTVMDGENVWPTGLSGFKDPVLQY
jgi:isopenicillin N synthase-like dioxygenase